MAPDSTSKWTFAFKKLLDLHFKEIQPVTTIQDISRISLSNINKSAEIDIGCEFYSVSLKLLTISELRCLGTVRAPFYGYSL